MLELNIVVCQSDVPSTINYWKSVHLYARKPHTVNRRLIGSKLILLLKYTGNDFNTSIDSLYNHLAILSKNEPELGGESMQSLLEKQELSDEFIATNIETLLDSLESAKNGYLVAVNKLIPKNADTCPIYHEFIIFDVKKKETSFYGLQRNECPVPSNGTGHARIAPSFRFAACAEQSVLLMSAQEESGSHNWLRYCLFPRFGKWLQSLEEKSAHSFNVESLSLIDIEAYGSKYNELKLKYGKEMVEIWPETTDPKKFVYEDVAIASYLLVLWKQERERKKLDKLQSFADLGCGNGLLVYILSSEGHEGFGIDVRKRGIWNLYPKTTHLREEAIVPSAQSLLPHTDWIIGNHSDELSPWIPVVAARSSHNSRYFLLPCCAYNFNGQKYQRQCSQRSQYEDFIHYAKTISDICGFHSSIDRLKIPSTKRIALIGDGRVHGGDAVEMAQRNEIIQSFIDAQCGMKDEKAPLLTDIWNADFVPRSNVELVRNCTKIDKCIEKEIINKIVQKILSKKRYIPNFENWNIGGKVLLADLAKELSKTELQELKSECGGLQTLLRNNSSIFLVQCGSVELRPPLKYSDKLNELEASKKKQNIKFNFKLKPCWFHSNHPDGCPLINADCSFKHE